MPELPEVETTLRGIAPHVAGRRVTGIVARVLKLRLPLAEELREELPGQSVKSVERRGKYLILRCDRGSLILHLGMSGSLRIVPAEAPPGRHDHLDILLDDGNALRFRDPRRFGLALWTREEPLAHPLLADLGPEPLTEAFDGDYLFRRSRQRRVAIKQFIMDSRVVAGVGNIYANEALFRAGIHTESEAGLLDPAACRRLAQAIGDVLHDAIAAGGTVLQEFVAEEESPGYFALDLRVYGRADEPCPACGTPIRQTRQGGRSTYFCPRCQT